MDDHRRVHFSESEDIRFADAASVDTLDPMDDQEHPEDKVNRWLKDHSGNDQDSGIVDSDAVFPEEGQIIMIIVFNRYSLVEFLKK